MLPLLAAIPAIFSAISAVPDLIEEGQRVFQTVTGQPPPADVEGLRAAVDAMPDEQKEAWAGSMAERIQMYEAETARLKVQGGEVNAETLAQFSQPVRDYIGKMRMVTRPLVVRRMSHVLLLPVYVLVLDGLASYVNSAIAFFSDGPAAVRIGDQPAEVLIYQIPMLATTFFAPGTLYVQLYSYAAPSAAAVVGTYMTLREMGKAGGPKVAAKSALDKVAGSVGSIVGLFKK